ncbi:MAG: PAS domain-containing protein [Opitutales bacterium]|nr:PAS domain-containing protein [Opitutales bacterium]
MTEKEEVQPTVIDHALPTKAPTRVVGIGASAGGLAALKDLLPKIPEKTNACFVIVMHLSSDHESHLADLLQASTPLPIRQISGTTTLEANQIYVIPPGANIEAIDGSLHLAGMEEHRQKRAPIDHFFRTLANAHQENAVGIILTGTGSDGTSGLRFIRESGGLTIVQSPEEAEYDSMPRSAIAAGVADLVLPLKQIPAQILKIATSIPAKDLRADTHPNNDPEEILRQILGLLQEQTGHDFSQYKRATINRRLRRRMQLHRTDDLNTYLKFLQTEEKEVALLFEDLLITVTEFFRDPPVFAHLGETIIPQMFAKNPAAGRTRVWSVGCATGEEAYSLCILLLEALPKELFNTHQIQIFATDLHEPSLTRAREGIFPKSIEADVSRTRLDQFFTSNEHHYRVKRKVREQVVFALHNVLQDPPFSHLHLISCRNVLIYLQREVQLHLISLFHYALEEDGYLLVGSADSVESDLFTCENKKLGLYRRRSVPTPGLRPSSYPLTSSQPSNKPSKFTPPASFGKLHEQAVELYAPPSLLMDTRGEMVHYSARAGDFLQFPGGTPTRNVFQLLPETLRYELRAALHATRGDQNTYRSALIKTTVNGREMELIVSVQSIQQPQMQGFYLVIFDEIKADPATNPGERKGDILPQIPELQTELSKARSQMQLMSEDHEETLERMQAYNEELESSNEELRSAMEELETSKEEMESINEELNSLNQENLQKVEELNKLSSDLNNLLKATHIATVFLDREMHIMRFTPNASELFNLRSIDLGRSLADITHQLKYDKLCEDIRSVLKSHRELEREVEDAKGHHYLARLQCYRTDDDNVEGIVITFIDISERKAGEKLIREAKELAEKTIETVGTPMLVLEQDLHMRSANEAFCACFRCDTSKKIKGIPLDQLKKVQWDLPALRQRLERIIPEAAPMVDFEMDIAFDHKDSRSFLINAAQIDRAELILMSLEDVTDRKRIRLELEDSRRKLEDLVTERTMELHQKTERLQSMVHELSTAEQRERKRMASILHDDLQQLLVAAKMQLEMGQRDSATGKFPDCLKRAISHIDDALETTYTLVRQANPRILYERGLFPAIESLCGEMLKKHGLTVHYDFPEEAFDLENEIKILLYESLRELFFNIVKHARVNQAQLHFEVAPESLSVRVSDEGVGFDVESKSGKKNLSEFGLFSVCARIEAMDESCTITSAPGEGTTVAMRFTLRPPRGARLSSQRPAKKKKQNRPLPVRVVVVDDHVLVREGIVKILNLDSRIQVVGEANDGREAISIIADTHPDIVLMDINMPRMNGIAATRKILRRWPEIRVLALSMQDSGSNEARSIAAAGAVGFLRKSDDSGKMISTLVAAMKT